MSTPTARLVAGVSDRRWNVLVEDGSLIGWVERDALGSWVPFVGSLAHATVCPPEKTAVAAGRVVAAEQGCRLATGGVS